MKTKIVNTIQQWVPEAVTLIPDIDPENSTADYVVLHRLADLCNGKIRLESVNETESVQEIVKVINLLYQGGNQYTRNAIENEFLTALSDEESPGSLKKHLALLPVELRKGYIKTILEN